MKKIYVVGNEKHYADFIDNRVLTDNIEEADIVIFTGGEDVSPSMYKCSKHPTTYSNLKRDKKEKQVFNKCVNLNTKLIIGICRGSQLLCVLNGGLLIQNVLNHAKFGTHAIINKNGEIYDITSTHHQMQYPFNLKKEDYDILYKSYNNYSYEYEGDKIDYEMIYNSTEGYVEPEIVLYHKQNTPKCLAIQGHPEYMDPESNTVKMLNKLINSLLK